VTADRPLLSTAASFISLGIRIGALAKFPDMSCEEVGTVGNLSGSAGVRG
jgi:hypothetical protein